jgi:hypothetical protein
MTTHPTYHKRDDEACAVVHPGYAHLVAHRREEYDFGAICARVREALERVRAEKLNWKGVQMMAMDAETLKKIKDEVRQAERDAAHKAMREAQAEAAHLRDQLKIASAMVEEACDERDAALGRLAEAEDAFKAACEQRDAARRDRDRDGVER